MRIFGQSGHVTEDGLALHTLNDLGQSQAERVDQHIRICPECTVNLRETREFITLVKGMAQTQQKRIGLNCAVGAIRLRTTPRLNAGRAVS